MDKYVTARACVLQRERHVNSIVFVNTIKAVSILPPG